MLVSSCLLMFVSNASASIQVGDTIRFQNGPGSPGGEFGIAFAATPTETEMISFCVERNEYINFTSDFYVESITNYANNGGVGGGVDGRDYVDARSAWLYYNFRMESLANYVHGSITDHSAGRATSANALQNALWFLEEEQTSAGVGQDYVDAANAEWTAFNTATDYVGNMQAAIDSIRIMNIRWNDETGDYAQSQMFMVPEPGSMAIWSLLGLGCVVLRRRSVIVSPKA